MFILQHLLWFWNLKSHNHQAMIRDKLGINLMPLDEETLDSTNSALSIYVAQYYAMKLGSSEWRRMQVAMKDGLKSSALMLNYRKLSGKAVKILTEILYNSKCTLNQFIMDLLTFEWENIIGILNRSIKRQPKKAFGKIINVW